MEFLGQDEEHNVVCAERPKLNGLCELKSGEEGNLRWLTCRLDTGDYRQMDSGLVRRKAGNRKELADRMIRRAPYSPLVTAYRWTKVKSGVNWVQDARTACATITMHSVRWGADPLLCITSTINGFNSRGVEFAHPIWNSLLDRQPWVRVEG